LQYKQQAVDYNGDIKCKIFEDLLFSKLLLDQAQLDSIEISENEIEDNLDRRIRYFVAQIGSEEKLEEFYGKSIAEIKQEFRDVLKNQMLVERMQSDLTKDVKVTPSEIRKFYDEIPKDSLPKIQASTKFQQIVVIPKISEKEKLQVKEQLRDFKERIKTGTKFSALAVLYSEDPGSAKKGGELGFVGRTDLVPEFAAVAFKLKTPDEVSKVVETEYGFHIIQLIEQKGEKINVRHILLKPKVSFEEFNKAQRRIDSLHAIVLADTITFEEAAKRYSDDRDTKFNGGYIINQETATTSFTDEQIDPALAYNIKGVAVGNITRTFRTKNEKDQDVLKFVKTQSKTNAHSANISTDYKIIQEMCIATKKQKEILKWVENKQKNTYMKIDKSYSNCNFESKGWVK
jgi:peptidyl-prolyl cis-trans isomerase SurA